MARQKLLLLSALVIVILQITHHVGAVKVLAIISVPLKSHYMAFQTLFRELAIRGHSVTVINNYPDIDPPPNLKFVNISIPLPNSFTPISEFELTEIALLQQLKNVQRHFVLGVERIKMDCENLFINENMEEFRSKGERFDVIFVEQFMSDCGLAYAAAFYEAPIIGITSHTLLPWAYPRMGIPFDFSSDAFYFSDAGTSPSLFSKLRSYLSNLYMQTLGRFKIQDLIYKVFNKYMPNNQLDIEKIAKERIRMMFVYQHYSITGARVLPPSLLEIGGLHIRKAKPVSKDIENFMSSAEHGVVYVSFGSNLKANTMSSTKLRHFLDTFKKVPQKVIWKIDNSSLAAGNNKVYANDWFPQLDILCHPKVVAFVSHGGMLSLSEAAHCGKPLLAIPFFGDQFSNSAAVRESGLGISMYFHEMTATTLADAIGKLTSPKMQENAKHVSKLWHDRPQKVMDSAIYWTEYVARHGDAPPALPSKSTTWFERSLIDVYSVLLAVVLASLVIVYLILRKVKQIVANLVKLLLNHNKLKSNKKLV